MSENNAIVKQPNNDQGGLMRPDDVKFRLDLVTDLLKRVMVQGIKGDYGIIPGTGDKPTLLKPGAEKLCMLFRLAPTYDRQSVDMGRGHREYVIACTLTHIPTGVVWGQGLGSGSTMESKYRWRGGGRKCPKCGAAAIKKSKFAPRGTPHGTEPGWYCYDKAGGCGENFAAGDPTVEGQETGRIENPDIADTYNTVLKMAMKRAFVGAVIVATGASALFTQDLDDGAGDGTEDDQAAPPRQQTNGNGHAKAAATPANGKPPIQEFEDRIDKIERKPKDGVAQADGGFWLVTTVNGTALSTLSDTLRKAIEQAIAENVPVAIQWQAAGKYKKLVEIFPAAENRPVEGELVSQ